MVSLFAFISKFRRRAAVTSVVEILPPIGSVSDTRAEPEWNLNASVEERADAFVSLFLNSAPKDLRDPRMGQFRQQ